jgi:hypothetical protein
VIRFLADENFDRHIVRGLRRRLPSIDIALAQKAGLTGMDDEVLLSGRPRSSGWCCRTMGRS